MSVSSGNSGKKPTGLHVIGTRARKAITSKQTRLQNDTSESSVKNVARKSTGTRPFQSTSKENTTTQNEEETETGQTQSVRRGRSSKFSEKESSNDKDFDMTEQLPSSRRGRPRKAVHEVAPGNDEERETTEQPSCSHRGRPSKVSEETFENDDEREMLLECLSRPRGRPRKKMSADKRKEKTASLHAIEFQNESHIKMIASDVEKKSEDERKEKTASLPAIEFQNESDIEMVASDVEKMTVENDTNILLSPRKGVAKKSTGTRATPSKSQQEKSQDEKKKKTESFPVTESENESDVDMISSDAEDVADDVQEEQTQHDSDIMVVDEKEMTVGTDTNILVSPRKGVAKKSTGTRAIQSKSWQQEKSQDQKKKKTPSFPVTESENESDVDMLSSDAKEMNSEIGTNISASSRKGVAKKSTGTRVLRSETQQDVTNDVQKDQTESDVDAMATNEEEMNSEIGTNISASSRKGVAKKSTGTRVLRSETQQSNKEPETHQSHYGNRSRVRSAHEEMSDSDEEVEISQRSPDLHRGRPRNVQEESPATNRKNPVRSRKKTQKKLIDSDSDYEESDEESPARNRTNPVRSRRKTQKKQIDSDDDYEGSDEEGPSTSQIRSQSDGKIDKEALIHKCVYYLLIADQKKHAIKKADIMKHVIKGQQKLYKDVIEGAAEVLLKIYGLEVTKLEKGNLMIVNNLTQELDVQQYSCLSVAKKQQQGLILYILLIIYMNENSISESDLWKALVPLGIKPSTQKSHPIFGDVQKYINSELVKQMYLDYVCISKDPPHYEYRWGPRATSEVDKLELLQFACLVLDKKPEDWILQYNDAKRQDVVENS